MTVVGAADTVRTGTILVVDDTPANIGVLLAMLGEHGHKVLVATDGQSALEQIAFARPDLILLDVMMPGMDGFEVCRRIRAMPAHADVPILFVTALDESEAMLRGFAVGAADYVTKPLRHAEVMARVNVHLALAQSRRALEEANATLESRVAQRTRELAERNAELAELARELGEVKDRVQRENVYLRSEVAQAAAPRHAVGRSRALEHVMQQVERVAPTSSTVLIVGESGVGKELIARAVHAGSPRAQHALIKLNCAAIASGLVESELFGHARGAFTGATEKRAGRFELADGGTLFLDEVSELPLDTQVKLLRVLQEREFEPVGSARTLQVDVRVVAASNRDLPTEVAAGRFRADLYHRLNVFPIAVPPLRARREDIPLLAEHFLERNMRALGRQFHGIEAESLQRLIAHDWPGNIRELQNVIERAAILCRGEWLVIEESMLPAAAVGTIPPVVAQAPDAQPGSPRTLPSLAEIQRQHIIAALRSTGGVIEGEAGAARLLDMKPSTARYRIQKLGITRRDYCND